MFSAEQTEKIFRGVLYSKQEWRFFLSRSVLVVFIILTCKSSFGVFSGSMTAKQWFLAGVTTE